MHDTGLRLTKVIFRTCLHDKHVDNTTEHTKNGDTEGYYSEKGKDSGYAEYVKKHGMHFTDTLATDAIKWLTNVGPDKNHKWSVGQVSQAATTMLGNNKTKHKVNMADLAYAANMFYADLFPEVIATEPGCIKAAIAIANDPDGYEGKIFSNWVSDIMSKGMEFDWKKYI